MSLVGVCNLSFNVYEFLFFSTAFKLCEVSEINAIHSIRRGFSMTVSENKFCSIKRFELFFMYRYTKYVYV